MELVNGQTLESYVEDDASNMNLD